jgi:hypothetical protein
MRGPTTDNVYGAIERQLRDLTNTEYVADYTDPEEYTED